MTSLLKYSGFLACFEASLLTVLMNSCAINKKKVKLGFYHLMNFAFLLCQSRFFFHFEISSESQTVWIQARADISSGII